MWWIIISVCVLSVIICLLFVSFFIEIDSVKGLFRIRFSRVASVSLSFKEQSVFLDLKITLWHKQIDLLGMKKAERKPAVRKKKKKKAISFQKILAVIKSFRVRKLLITVDTGNMQGNGILFPLFTWLSLKSKKNITVNFLDENIVILQIENNIARMIWAFIRS